MFKITAKLSIARALAEVNERLVAEQKPVGEKFLAVLTFYFLRFVAYVNKHVLETNLAISRSLIKMRLPRGAYYLLKLFSIVFPNNYKVRLDLARACERLARWDEACGQWAILMRIRSDFARAHLGRARCEGKAGRYDLGLEVLQNGLVLFPENIDIAKRCAKFAMCLKRWEFAEEAWSALFRSHREELKAKSYAQYAMVLRRNHKFDRAKEILSEGESRFPTSFVILTERAELSLATKDWAAALDARKEVAMRRRLAIPKRVFAQLVKASQKCNRMVDAQTWLQRGLKKFPRNQVLLLYGAEIAVQKKNWAEAIKFLRKILSGKCPPRYAKVYFLASRAFTQLGDFESAMQVLELAASQIPNHPDIPYARAVAVNAQAKQLASLSRIIIADDSDCLAPDWDAAIAHWNVLAETANNESYSTKFERDHWRAFIYRAEVLSGEGSLDAATELFKRGIDSRSEGVIGLPSECVDVLVSIFKQRHINDKYDLKLKNDAEKWILDIAPSALSLNSWLNLFEFLATAGLLKCAAFARQKAIDRTYLDFEHFPDDYLALQNAARMAIDQGDHSFEAVCIEKLGDSARKIKNFYNLNVGNLASVVPFQGGAEYEKFGDLIQGRSVAIVGPAPSTECGGEEIDDFDIVIRPNYRGKEFLPDPLKFGSKTDISYYNGEVANVISNTENLDFFNDLKFSVFKWIRYRFQNDLVKKWAGKTLSPNIIAYFNGHANAIQCILADVLPYGPSRVKVFNTNFFCSTDLHCEGYKANLNEVSKYKSLKDIRYCMSSFLHLEARHDFLSQINFCRNLWHNNLIEVDQVCANILRLDAVTYMERMEQIYIGSLFRNG